CEWGQLKVLESPFELTMLAGDSVLDLKFTQDRRLEAKRPSYNWRRYSQVGSDKVQGIGQIKSLYFLNNKAVNQDHYNFDEFEVGFCVCNPFFQFQLNV